MKRRNSQKLRIIVIITIIISILAISSGVFLWNKSKQKVDSQNNANSSQESTNNLAKESNDPTINKKENNPTPTTNVPIPQQPDLSKSSGNNGPVPAGANMNFICTAQPNIDCSIVLVSGTKQTVLGPTKVSDNGRGQYFASFYLTSVKGSYKITAQAKNSQGGVSSSITQALEVQ